MGVPLQELTLAAFLDWENAQLERHEFHRGEVFAMVGGRRSHGRVVLNLARRLAEQLDGSPCQVFAESMKVQVADDTILYPDVFVTCDKADLATEMIFRAPMLVIEVLSPATQAYDRSQKFALYRRLASLREYILVDPDTRRIEAFRCTAEGAWVFDDMSQEREMAVSSVACAVSMDQVFDGVDPQA
ncbi:MAG TPA: Uma2 family endonuclease [Burkholderiaceae bacterium]|nr:Uma2 family endonuclease [Burkholderiaceae bacterium]